jgi:transposase-like protein
MLYINDEFKWETTVISLNMCMYKSFSTEAQCIAHLEKVRWHGQPICPYCKSNRVKSFLRGERYHCNNCNTKFSVTVGTVFHRTHLPLQKWFLAISLVLNAGKNIPARQLAQDLDINKNTAWYLISRIDRAMLDIEQRELMLGVIA